VAVYSSVGTRLGHFETYRALAIAVSLNPFHRTFTCRGILMTKRLLAFAAGFAFATLAQAALPLATALAQTVNP
jgi:hypothetical protein